jgi:hypothetical protein
MRKAHYPRYYPNSAEVPDNPNRRIVMRQDLEGEELKIYDRYLAKLDHPSADQLRMLATYAWLAVELTAAAADHKKALYIRRCMIYARNGLHLWKPLPISSMALLLDDGNGFEMTFFSLYLDRAWQVGED